MQIKKTNRILIIDDDMEICSSLKLVLSNLDLDSISSTSFHDATWKLDNEKFNLIISDYNLGKKTLEDLINRVKSQRAVNYETPIFLISGSIKLNELKPIKESLAAALVKPFNTDDFTNRVKSTLML